MRLTLRTLLSYLDGVHLTPDEREALRQQIEKSENASEWIHRTRDVMRRLKLGAPEIDGTGSADDPNSVAEYLDRSLPDESVAEFERVCLESDPMLAEVAACHHVLAMFLAEQAHIDPDTRNRLHRLQADLAESATHRIEHPPTPPAVAETPPAPPAEPQPEAAAPAPPRRRKMTSSDGESHVPGYLAEREGADWKRWAPAIAALLLLGVTAGIAFLPGGPLNPNRPEVAKNEPGPAPIVAEPGTDSESDQASEDGTPTDDRAAGAAGDGEADTASEETTEEASTEVAPADDGEPPAEPSADGEPMEATPEVEEPAEQPREPTEEPSTDGADEAPAEGAGATDDGPEETPAPEPAPPIVFDSGPESLAVHEIQPDSWRRLETGFKLAGPTRVTSLPNYRNRFVLSPTLTAELVGLTDMVLAPPTEAGLPAQIDLRYGRVALANAVAATAPAVVEVVIEGEINLVAIDPGATVAIHADRLFQPGWPVEELPTELVAVAHTVAGAVEWTTRGESDRVPMPNRRLLSPPETESRAARLGGAGWFEGLPISKIDQDAAVAVAGIVEPGKAIWPQLRTIVGEDRWRENRALAAWASLSLGHPESVIETFADPKEFGVWERNLAWLRQAASRDVGVTDEVRRAFEMKTSRQEADELMDLMIGFTPTEIGVDPEAIARGSISSVVVPALESPELATRVLASLALQESVTGAEGLFDPRQSERRREVAMLKIRNRLEDGELSPRVTQER